jgi:DNA-binding transcriptional LysR family regulator
METDRLNGLIALKTVAEKRNFRAAAEVLGVSTPAVSQAIRTLEKRLGVTLLSRSTRSTSPTEAGIRFLSEAGPAIDQILSAMDKVGSFADKPSGLLRINLPRSAYPNLMAPLIESFMGKYPEVTVELFFDDDLSDIVEGGFDAGIRLSEMIALDMVALKLTGPIHFYVVGSPKYFRKMGKPKQPKDLLSHNCIRLRTGENEMYDHWEFEQKGKNFQVKVGGTLITNDSFIAKTAALNGTGLLYTTDFVSRAEVESGKFEVVLESFAARSGGLYLYYPKKSQALPKLRVFVDHLKSEIHNTSL